MLQLALKVGVADDVEVMPDGTVDSEKLQRKGFQVSGPVTQEERDAVGLPPPNSDPLAAAVMQTRIQQQRKDKARAKDSAYLARQEEAKAEWIEHERAQKNSASGEGLMQRKVTDISSTRSPQSPEKTQNDPAIPIKKQPVVESGPQTEGQGSAQPTQSTDSSRQKFEKGRSSSEETQQKTSWADRKKAAVNKEAVRGKRLSIKDKTLCNE